MTLDLTALNIVFQTTLDIDGSIYILTRDGCLSTYDNKGVLQDTQEIEFPEGVSPETLSIDKIRYQRTKAHCWALVFEIATNRNTTMRYSVELDVKGDTQ